MTGLERAIAVVKRLRSPTGCPWDRAQTHESLRPYLLEETYEALEALDSGSPENLKEELGDVLLQVLLHAEIASEKNQFTIDELAESLAEKLERRHPHVFGGAKLETAEDVTRQWEITKQKEKKKDSVLEGIPAALPALQKSLKVIEKVSKVGFQWPSLEGPLGKVHEELAEFLAELEKAGPAAALTRDSAIEPKLKSKLEAELGDLLFTLANVAYFLHLNPEDALRSMLLRFEQRFRHVEKRAKESGQKLEDLSLEEMDRYWEEAKS
jgi:tetrapyrrole methylase family protein/MazG family protein